MKSKQSSESTLRQGPVLIAAAVLLLVGAIVLPPLMRKESVKPVEEKTVVEAKATNTVSETVKTNLQGGAKQVEFTLRVALGKPPRRMTNGVQFQNQQ